MRNQKELATYAHFGAWTQVQFQLLSRSYPQSQQGELSFDAHLGEIAHEDSELIGDFFEQELSGHLADLLTLCPEARPHVATDAMRHELPLVDQLQTLNSHPLQPNKSITGQHLLFSHHLAAFLQQCLDCGEGLDLLNSCCGGRREAERVLVIKDLQHLIRH